MNITMFGRKLSKNAPRYSYVAQVGDNLAQRGPNFQLDANLAPTWPNLAHPGSNLAQLEPNLVTTWFQNGTQKEEKRKKGKQKQDMQHDRPKTPQRATKTKFGPILIDFLMDLGPTWILEALNNTMRTVCFAI